MQRKVHRTRKLREDLKAEVRRCLLTGHSSCAPRTPPSAQPHPWDQQQNIHITKADRSLIWLQIHGESAAVSCVAISTSLDVEIRPKEEAAKRVLEWPMDDF